MASQSALQDPVGPPARQSGQVGPSRPVAALPLDPLIAALSQAARRSGPAKPRGQDPDPAD
ncbi:MAG: hypothetical protein C0426_14805 [Rhodobacter sp.]|nr:hypothetical protein [Rhodobacter sp.]